MTSLARIRVAIATFVVAHTACVASTSNAPASSAPASTVPANVTATHTIEWNVDVSEDFVVDERVCWDGPMTRVIPEDGRALRYATAVDESGRALRIDDDGVALTPDARCAIVRVDLGRAAREIDDRDVATMRNGAVVASPDVWLWRPEPWPRGRDGGASPPAPADASREARLPALARTNDDANATHGALTLHTAAGTSASVPWQKRSDGRYDVTYATWNMVARTAFGKLVAHEFDVDDAHFTVTRLPGPLHVSDAGIDKWLTSAANAVSTVDGHFPVKTAQILLVPIDFGGRSVPFGMAVRGGGPGAIILVSRGAHDDDLVGEWVSVHELSHLLIPPVKRGDPWLSEGLASYYQQIVRGRAGLLSEQDAWGGLVDGFDRGREDGPDEPLAKAAGHMGFPGAGYVRVYWGGAAILFELDVALRQKGRSLDELVANVRKREPVDVTYRAADDVVAGFATDAPDVDVRGIVARGLAAKFPDVEPDLEALGIRRAPHQGDEKRALLDDDAPLAAVRRAIMRRGDTKPPNVVNSGR